jgi:hypothetical protein
MPELPLEDVLVILRVWKDERQVIYFHIGESEDDPALFAFGVGAIEELTSDFLRIDSRSADPPEMEETRVHGCTVSLKRADWFALWDWRDVPAEEESRKKLLRESYDAMLTVAFGHARCVLRTLRAPNATLKALSAIAWQA